MTDFTPSSFREPEKAPQSPISGTYSRLVILSSEDWYIDGNWKLVTGTTTTPGFLDLSTGNFVPVTSVALAQRKPA